MKKEQALLSSALLLTVWCSASYANWGKGGSVSGYAPGAGYPTADPNLYGCGGSGSTASYAGTFSGTAGTNSSNGNGGGGGVSLTTSSPLTTLSSDIIVGGGGGYGTGSGRQGGAGGIGLSITAPLTNAGIIVGGGGGSTTGASSAVEMHGGAGAVGVLTTAPVINTGTIYGGGGGNGRNTSASQYGGSGGSAISTTANVTNSGILSGGGGGSHNSYFDQSGGAGVYCAAAGLYILNTGSISGGLNGNGGSYDWAIIFQGSNNTLELQAGYSFPNGSIYNAAATTNNLLLLSGATSPVSVFDISGIGTIYQNFTQIRKSGTSVWTFTRSGTTPALPIEVSSGTARLNASNALGTGALTLSGGGLQAGASVSVANALTLTADLTLDANNYTFTVTNSGSVLNIVLGRTLTLRDTSVAHTGTVALTNGLTLNGTLNVGSNVSGGGITLNAGTQVIGVGSGTVSNALTLAGDTTLDSGGYALGFSGNGASTAVSGARTLTLTDSSGAGTGQISFTNGLTLNGTLLVSGQTAGGTIAFNAGGLLRSNASTSVLNTLSFSGASSVDSNSYDLTFTNNGLLASLPALSTLTLENTNAVQTGGIHLPNGMGVAGTLIVGTSLSGGLTLNTGGVITSNRNVTIDSTLTVAGNGALDASGYQIDFTNNSTPISVPATRILTLADSSVGQTGQLSIPNGFALNGTLFVNTLFTGGGAIALNNAGMLQAGLNATLSNAISVSGTGTVDANNYTFSLTNNGGAINVPALSALALRDTSVARTGSVSIPNGLNVFGALNVDGNVSGGTVALEAGSNVQGLGDSVLNNPVTLAGDATIDAGGYAIDLLNNGLSLAVPAARTLLATDSSMGGLGTLHFPNGFTLGGTLQVGTDFSGGPITFDTAGILKANKNATLVNDLIVSGTSTIDANNHVLSLSNNGIPINVPTLSNLVLRDTSVAHTGSVALPNGANVSGSLGVGGDVSGGALALGAGASAYGVGAGTVNNTLTLSGNATLDAAGYGLSFTNNGAVIAVPATQTLTMRDSSVGQTGQLNFPNGISLDGTLGIGGSVAGGLMDMNDGARITGIGGGSISNALTLGANVIWDAAGYALTFTNNGAAVAVTNIQTLTVQDSSVGQTGQLILPNGIFLDGTLGVGGNVSGGAVTLNAGSRVTGQGSGAVDNTLTLMGDTTMDAAGYGLTFTNNGAVLAVPAAQTLSALDSSVSQTGQLNFPHGFTLDGTLLVGAKIQGGSITLNNTGVLKAANNANLANLLNLATGSILDSNGLNLTLTNGGTLISVAALDTLTLDNTNATKTGGVYLPSGVDVSGTLIAGANVAGPITLNSGSAVTTNQNATVNSMVALAGDTTLHNAGHTLTFTGSGSALTVPATRTLSLTGAGTTAFTNGMDLSGVLDVNTSTGGGAINFSAGGQVVASGNISVANSLTFSSGSGNMDTAGHTMTLTSSGLTVPAANALILHDSSLGKTGHVVLPTMSIGGTLSTGSAISGGTLTFNGGSALVANDDPIVAAPIVAAGDMTVDNGGFDLTLTGGISGPGKITFLGTDVTTLAVANPAWSGGSIIGDGAHNTTVALGASTSLGTGNVLVAAASILDGAPRLTTNQILSGLGTVTGVVNNNGGVVTPGTQATPYGILTMGGYAGAGTMTFSMRAAAAPVVGVDNSGIDLGASHFDPSQTNLALTVAPGTYVENAKYDIIKTTGLVNGTFLNEGNLQRLGAYQPRVTYDRIGGFDTISIVFDRIQLPPTPGQGGGLGDYLNGQNPPVGSPTGELLGQLSEQGDLEELLRSTMADPSNKAVFAASSVHNVNMTRLSVCQSGTQGPRGGGISLVSTSVAARKQAAHRSNFLDQKNETDVLRSSTKSGFQSAVREAMAAQANAEKGGVWSQAFGNLSSQDNTADVLGFKALTGGMMVGVDMKVDCQNFIGVSGGVTKTLMKMQKNRGTHHINAYSMSIYGTWFKDGLYLDYSLMSFVNVYKMARRVAIGSYAPNEVLSRHLGFGISPYVGVSYDLKVGKNTRLTPFTSLTIIHMHDRGYDEEGGLIHQRVAARRSTFLSTDLGVSLSREYEVNDKIVVPSLSLAYGYKKPIRSQDVVAGFNDAAGTYTVQTSKRPIHEISPSVETTVRFEDGLYFSTSYNGEFSHAKKSHEVTFKIGKRF
ncbi:MAG: hypothetical protein C0514_03000 [Candidatus Puniceispirillum sp.]|nr:hypothetical protein [Candidatus Puniceispirillum sp.]